MKNIKVYVTKQDIKKGEPAETYKCAVTLALKKRLGIKDIRVEGSFCSINGDYYALPKKVCYFVSRYDRLVDVKPFSFTFKYGKT